LNLKKLLSVLILSTVIIVALITIGDLGEFIEQTNEQNQIVDFGIVRDCNPSIAVCSITGVIDNNKIKVSAYIGEPIYLDNAFPLKLSISRIKPSQIDSITVSLNLPGVNIQKNEQYFRMQSKDQLNMTSQWKSSVKIPQIINKRSNWLAIVGITINGQKIQILYQLQFEHR